jgi:hypothetical protein
MREVLLIGSNTGPKTHREIADVILMCKAMETTDFQIRIENRNPEIPDKSIKILRYSKLAPKRGTVL